MNVFYKPDDDLAAGAIGAEAPEKSSGEEILNETASKEDNAILKACEKDTEREEEKIAEEEEDEIDLLMKKYGYGSASDQSVEKRDREYAAEIDGISGRLFFVDGSEYSDDKKGITTVSIKTASGYIGKRDGEVVEIELSASALKNCGILSPSLKGEKILVLDDGFKVGTVALSVAAGDRKAFLFSEKSSKFLRK